MGDIVATLQTTPVPAILVLAGSIFLFAAVVGRVAGQLEVPRDRQKWAGVTGVLLLVGGIALYAIPAPPPASTPTIVTAIIPDALTPPPAPTDTPTMGPTNTPAQKSPTNASTPTPSETSAPSHTPTDTPVEVDMWCDVYSKLSGPAGDPASRSPETFFYANVRGHYAEQVVVESPSGETVVLAPDRGIWGGEGSFSGHIQGMPQAGGTYTCIALNADGLPIPGATASDVYVGGYELDPPTNVHAEVVEDGVLVTWAPSPVVPGAFDPGGAPPVGNYLVNLRLYAWNSSGIQLLEASHLIPFHRRDFGPGDEGRALEEMEDGLYHLGLHAFSVAPEETAGQGIEGEAVPEDEIRIIIEGGQVRIEEPQRGTQCDS